MPRQLSGLFDPKSIAVIGASENPQKVGAIALKNILVSGFKGRVYAVNPNIKNIGNFKFYPDVASLPEIPDLAVIAIPAPLVNSVLEEIGQKGIKNVLIFSAGFKETGAEGAAMEKQLIAIAGKYGLNILGPNCLGFASPSHSLNATFGQVNKTTGNLRIISQSGAIAASLFDWSQATGLGFDDFITIGNKSVINENDILEYWTQNQLPDGSPIGLYLESISHGPEFVKITREISLKNPIYILKPGKTSASSTAMRSHTGSIAGEDYVLDAALSQAGIIRCQELGDFFDLSLALSWVKAPMGPNVAVVSNAGGPAVLSTDTIIEHGLSLAKFTPETQQKLTECLPRITSFLNPVDVLGDALADRFGQAAEIVLNDSNTDSVLVILTPQLMTQIEKTATIISSLFEKYHKPIFCSFIGGTSTLEGLKILNRYRLPGFTFPEQAVKTLSQMWQWQKWRNLESAKISSVPDSLPRSQSALDIISQAQKNKSPALDNNESSALAAAIGIPTPPSAKIADVSNLNSFSQTYGWPLVVKLSSEGLLHKADVGGVITMLQDEDQLTAAYNGLLQKINSLQGNIQKPIAIEVQKQIEAGVEVILGAKRDSVFGPVLLFGAGGKSAELLVDRNLHLLPLTRDDAVRLVEKSQVYKLLSGFRGDLPYDLNDLYEIILKLGQFFINSPEIAEMEINPLIITHHGCWAVDTKVLLTPSSTPSALKTGVAKRHDILASTYHFVSIAPADSFSFTPGQYVSVKVADTRMNCYSIAGQTADGQLEFIIDTSPSGVGSHFFENLKVGDTLNFAGPLGKFTYQNEETDHILFLATGSGIAPFRSIIKSLLEDQHVASPITLYFGLRQFSDIFWQQEFEELSKSHPNFTFKLCLSHPDAAWQGLSGHITTQFAKDFPDAKNCSAYLCGGKAMIEEAQQLLLAAGCLPGHIHFEKY
ncbi:MAG TPA: acetate--CoA ligase family protein [Patescibacteria group bacterium]